MESTKIFGKEVRRSLRKDRRRCINKVSGEVEMKLQDMDITGAFEIIRKWYRKYSGLNMEPLDNELEERRKNYGKLFTFKEKENTKKQKNTINMNIKYDGDDIKDGIPTEKEIVDTIKKMK